MPWVCGPKCPLCKPNTDPNSSYDWLCHWSDDPEELPFGVEAGEDCLWTLEDWEIRCAEIDEQIAMLQQEKADLGKALAARRAEEVS